MIVLDGCEDAVLLALRQLLDSAIGVEKWWLRSSFLRLDLGLRMRRWLGGTLFRMGHNRDLRDWLLSLGVSRLRRRGPLRWWRKGIRMRVTRRGGGSSVFHRRQWRGRRRVILGRRLVRVRRVLLRHHCRWLAVLRGVVDGRGWHVGDALMVLLSRHDRAHATSTISRSRA